MGTIEFRQMDSTGDTKVEFDPENEAEVEAAKEQFESLLEKGMKAFLVKKDGKTGRQVKIFNPKAERYIFVPEIGGG